MLSDSQNIYKKENTLSLVLSNFSPIILNQPISQETLLDTFAKLVLLANSKTLETNNQDLANLSEPHKEILEKIYRYGVSPKVIDKRQVNIIKSENSKEINPSQITIFPDPLNNAKGEDLSQRMHLFGKIVDQVLEKAYFEETSIPDDIIHVSCSGYLAPSPVEKMVSKKLWRKTTVTHSYHMGCYGSIPALRMASGFLAASHCGLALAKKQIDIIHSEFLTLHVDLTRLTPRDILAMTLFGDGFIKYSVCPKDSVNQNQKGLKILALKETIIPNSLDEMLWNLSSHNFEMILSKKIPFLIRDNILSFVNELMAEVGLDFAKEKDKLVFAIHPGGPKIIEFIQKSLKLEVEQVIFSHNILAEFGNMSSATLPFIWERILSSKEIPSKTLILSIAFGPGLTAAGAVMEKL
jgi:predicted naringenin-chalcone synthase